MHSAGLSAAAAEAKMKALESRLEGHIKLDQGQKTQQGFGAASAQDFQAMMSALVKNQMAAGSMTLFANDPSKAANAISGSSNMLNMGMLTMLKNIAAQNGNSSNFNGLWSMPPTMNSGMIKSRPFDLAHFPVKGKVSSHFSDMSQGHAGRSHPISGHKHSHMGVDIAARQGAPIQSPWAGQVAYVGNIKGMGSQSVIVAHPQTVQPDGKILYSVFGHNDKATVNPGDFLSKGETLGQVGSKGHSTGPHLHWETRWADPKIDPRDLFKASASIAKDPLSFA